jgi:NAD-dependent SIR2 family protein deacetylase
LTAEFKAAARYSIERAKDLLANRRLLTITGAGLSTDSGIPDYRGEGRVQKHPMTFDTFMGSHQAQVRYWARSFVGWSRIVQAQPNAGHRALAQAEATGQLFQLITQNVDGLHQAAGSKSVIDLHGRLDRVACVGCGDLISRAEMDARLSILNPDVSRQLGDVEFSPDGDAEVEVSRDFRIPSCGGCGGHYKPDVVFFGESVPQARVQAAEQALAAAEAILVAGSSLTVNSGLKLVRAAHKRELPIVIVNLGETKADSIADAKIRAGTSETLELLLND